MTPEQDANSDPTIQHNQINEYPWLPLFTHYIQWYPHVAILKATLPSLKGFSQLFDHITASTQLPIHTLMIKGNIMSPPCMCNQTLTTLYNVHANVNSMTNCGSSQPGNSINQIISQIIQRDRSAVDDHSQISSATTDNYLPAPPTTVAAWTLDSNSPPAWPSQRL